MVSLPTCSTVTFTPGNTVGASHDQPAVYSSSASLDTGFGTNRTPAGWPATGALIKAVEIELTVTSQFTADGEVQVAVADPASLNPLTGATSDASGTWTGWDGGVGTYRTSSIDAYYLDKFGGWRTDYLTWSGSSATSNGVSTGNAVALQVTEIDLRARVRCADWDASTGDRRTIAARYSGGGTGSWIWGLSGSNVQLLLHRTGLPNDYEFVASCAHSTLGLVDGQWADMRVTYDNVNRVRWYDVNGALVQTDAVGDMTDIMAGSAPLWLGNNRNAGGRSAGGLLGDIEWFEMRDGSGNLVQTLTLDGMDSSTDTGWTPTVGGGWFRDTGVTVTGSTIPATKRVRIDLDTPCAVEDFRLIVDAQTGALTVDEIILEALCVGGIYVDGAVHLA
jgi:hypothetical protein